MMRFSCTSSAGALARVAALLGALWGPAAAQETGYVRSARVDVDLTAPGGDALVRVEYDVVPGPGGSVPLELLEPVGSAGIEVRDAQGAPVALAQSSGALRAGTVAAEVTSVRDAASLAFEYAVADAVHQSDGAYFVQVPVLGVSLPPSVSAVEVFSVTVRTPDRWSVIDGFPSRLRASDPGRYEATLPVVPAMVGLRGRTDGAWRPGVDLLVELLTLGVLTVFVVLGWRRLRVVAG